MSKQSIIQDFLHYHEEFSHIEWDDEYKDITVYFNATGEEPFSVTEFLIDSPTRNAIEELIDKLSAEDSD